MLVRSFHFAVGVTATALAIAGAVLPLLPTVPFLLIAAWAFARSSPRLEAWLLDHARFGPLIADWRRNGAIARPAKRLSAIAMVATVAVAAAAGLPTLLLLIQVAVLVAVSLFIWTRPDPDTGPRTPGARR
ncbi:YbaN family protein [Pinisolibacter sp.]|uniref:YbaN family protein n=1 Tax=Pinisolibacter sp. TaxID=2172024 RepID=UPI002FDCD86F